MVGRPDESGSGHDPDDGPDEVELPDVALADRAGHDAAYERARDAEQDCHPDADGLAPRKQQPGEDADDDADDDEAEDLHKHRFLPTARRRNASLSPGPC